MDSISNHIEGLGSLVAIFSEKLDLQLFPVSAELRSKNISLLLEPLLVLDLIFHLFEMVLCVLDMLHLVNFFKEILVENCPNLIEVLKILLRKALLL